MPFPKLFVKEIKDEFVQENFKRVEDYYRKDPLDRSNFEFLEVNIPSAVTASAFPHFLGYMPKDVILMHNLNNASVTFHYSLFDKTNLYITSSGITTLRMLIGRYI
jgi:hypothetical protein